MSSPVIQMPTNVFDLSLGLADLHLTGSGSPIDVESPLGFEFLLSELGHSSAKPNVHDSRGPVGRAKLTYATL